MRILSGKKDIGMKIGPGSRIAWAAGRNGIDGWHEPGLDEEWPAHRYRRRAYQACLIALAVEVENGIAINEGDTKDRTNNRILLAIGEEGDHEACKNGQMDRDTDGDNKECGV